MVVFCRPYFSKSYLKTVCRYLRRTIYRYMFMFTCRTLTIKLKNNLFWVNTDSVFVHFKLSVTQKIVVSLGMTTNTVEQAVPEVTVRDLLTQHALRVNCAVRAPCKVSRIYTYCISFVRSFLPSFICSCVRPFFLMPSFVLIHGYTVQYDYTWAIS